MVVGNACLTWMDHASLFFSPVVIKRKRDLFCCCFEPLSLHMLQTGDSEESSLTGGCGK
jgi:hypothetical protein